MSGSSSAIADIGQSRRAASSAQPWRMEAPSCRSSLRRLWLAGAGGEEARAGWFGLLRQDQLVCLGDEQPVFLAVMEDHDLPPSAEQLGAGDARGRRHPRTRRPDGGRILTMLGHALSSLICCER